jgi:transcriptional regulator with XRE-family HTH domain
MTHQPLASHVALLRAARNISQADLAATVGISPASMSNIERGRRQISPEVGERLAVALGIPAAVIADGEFAVVARDRRVTVQALTD